MRAKAVISAPTPFKGDSFPEYVLHQVARKPATATAQSYVVADNCMIRARITTPPPASNAPVPVATTATTFDRKTPSTTSRIAARSSYRRPSLSQQLQAISQGAQAITTQLQGIYNLSTTTPSLAVSGRHHTQQPMPADPKAFQATTIGLSVGKLECRFPCPVTFAHDHCTYLFQHPFAAKEVQMIMYYRDMLQAAVTLSDRSFRFRLARVLEQFGDDYSPANAQHWIRIVLATASEAHKVKRFLAELRVVDVRRCSPTTRLVPGR